MGIKIITVSDLSGVEGAQRHSLTVNGRTREFDATLEEFEALKAAQDLYARFLKVSTILPSDKPVHTKSNRPKPRIVRAWALANGHDIGDRGRISARVYDAYNRNL